MTAVKEPNDVFINELRTVLVEVFNKCNSIAQSPFSVEQSPLIRSAAAAAMAELATVLLQIEKDYPTGRKISPSSESDESELVPRPLVYAYGV
jgi:hypothetical protein